MTRGLDWVDVGLSFAAVCIVAGLATILILLWEKYR